MELNKFLHTINIPATNERQVTDFVAVKGKQIDDAVLKIWDEYSQRLNVEPDGQAVLADECAVIDEAEIIASHPHSKTNTAAQAENTKSNAEMKFGQENNTAENKEEAKNRAFDLMIKNKDIKLPPGKVNQEYFIRFDIEHLGIPDLASVSFTGLETIGLRYIPEGRRIEGVPNRAGDHKITMHCVRKDRTNGRPIFDRDITLIVNPDPRSLWNNIPTPTDIIYYKPDEATKLVRVGDKTNPQFIGSSHEIRTYKTMIAASQRGRSHAHEGRPRDDDFRLMFNSAGWYIMVVADGAGSAQYSRKGSQIACETALNVCDLKLRQYNDSLKTNIRLSVTSKMHANDYHNKIVRTLYEVVGQAAFHAYRDIHNEATLRHFTLKDYSTTLLISVVKWFEIGWFIASFWVGDGGIAIYRRSPAYLKTLGEPDGGEYAGQTRFLTMAEIFDWDSMSKRIRFDIVPDFTALVLMTDGVSDPKFETDANLNRIEKWHDLWDDLNGNNAEHTRVDFAKVTEDSPKQLLQWLDFWSRGNHDDRTIAILF
jgi:serine/threonine protein phosphatase PrpC